MARAEVDRQVNMKLFFIIWMCVILLNMIQTQLLSQAKNTSHSLQEKVEKRT